jgi:hypothetical protein
VGATHDVHEDGKGPVARKADGSGICLACGAAVELPEGSLVDVRLAGGPADPAALERPARRGGGGARKNGTARAGAAPARAGGGRRKPA